MAVEPAVVSGAARGIGIGLVVIVAGLAAAAAIAGGLKVGRRFAPFGRTIGGLVMAAGGALLWSLVWFTAAVIADGRASAGLDRVLGVAGLAVIAAAAIAAVALLVVGNVRTARRVRPPAAPDR